MRIGVMVGKLADGTFEYLGKPGQIEALQALQRKINDDGGKVKLAGKVKQFVKTWIQNAAGTGCRSKKCI